MNNSKQCVVIGGEGCIGRSLVVRLLKIGNWIVRIVDSPPTLSHQNSLISTALNDGRAFYLHLHLHNKSQLITAVQGAHTVFYIESSDSYLGDYYQCYMRIVQGAKSVVSACLECNVERLIYNCTSDVVFDGWQTMINADELVNYPWKYPDMLSDLRAQAESLILSANKRNGLLTCSLRPSNVFGPSDTYLVPSLIKQANSFLAKFILGNGDKNCDFTYVENVAHSHICAAEAESNVVGGKAFFITNLEPIYYSEFVSQIYKYMGYQRPIIKFPAWILGYVLMLSNWLRDQLEYEYMSPELLLTQFSIESVLFTRTFSCIAAEQHLRYSPIVSLHEGLTLTLKSFCHFQKENHPTRYTHLIQESKAENLLNNGKVADILLWRNEKDSFIWFIAFALLFYWFFLGETSFITSVARLLLLVSGLLFSQKYLPLTMLGFNIQRESLSYVQISNSRLRATILMMASFWNKGVNVGRALAQGKNWNIFLKALIHLYLLKLMLSNSSRTLLCLAMILSFTSFFTYEQYEARIDGFLWILTILIRNLKRFLFTRNAKLRVNEYR